MQVRRQPWLFAAAGMALVVATANVIHAQQPPPPPDDAQAAPVNAAPAQPEGVEVMTRGPVHEAFAEPVIRAPRATPVVAQQPPAAIQEVPPDQRPDDPNAVWIPGYWAWENDQSNFIWISGIWRVPPPRMQWTPGYWAQANNGSQWVPGFWSSTDQTQTSLLPEPPDPVNEAPPPQPDASSNYVPGCWLWQTTQYMWRPGFWMAYQPGWTWVPARYVWTPAGYIFCDGHWDYVLANRGLLFAPVQFTANIWNRPNWFYQPRYVVSDQFLLGALFVRTDVNCYYFGDYFGQTYVQAGFVPWVDFRIGNRYYDPLLSYYRWHHREDPRWMRTLQDTYVARASGEARRPPRTLQQQLALSAQIGNTPRDQVAIASLSAVTPLNRLQNQRLQRVPENQMRQLQQQATQLRTLSQDRRQLDVRLRQQGQVATQTSHPVAVNLPRTNIEHRVLQGRSAPPPAPSLPRADTTIRQAGPAGQENRQVPGRGGEAFPADRGMNPRRDTRMPTEPNSLPRQERGVQPGQQPVPGQQPTPERRPVMPDERVAPGRGAQTPVNPPRGDPRIAPAQPPVQQQPMPERRPITPQEQPVRPPAQATPAQPQRQPMPEQRPAVQPHNPPQPAMQPRTPPQPERPPQKPPDKPGEHKPPQQQQNPGERKPPR